MATIEELEKEINQIKERNKKVEIDKTWERSWARKFILTIFTYLSVGFYLMAINIQKPWLNAIVPAIAFMLSTLTMTFFKKIWLKFYIKK
jgi:sterol desaturase/sphingolipid hydroxylase (fatty acid hydroxylase superfamily)